MDFDAHVVASEVSESGQHISDKLCVVPGLIVANKVLHDQDKVSTLPVPLGSLSLQTLHL